MERISKAELTSILNHRKNQACLDLSGYSFEGMNLKGMDMQNTTLLNCNFRAADLTGANLRGCNLTGAHLEGANMLCTNLEGTVLEGVHTDAATRYYRMKCPESGAFVAYKVCFNYRVVQLLIPADAKRSSATNDACRCNKAKVLSIKSIDETQNHQEATAFADADFVYEVGKMAEVKNFNEDRWADSTTGIHFYMTREEAVHYM